MIRKQLILEILLLRHFKEKIDKDILYSDKISDNNQSIKYTIDDMGSYYLINVTMKLNDIEYNISLEMKLDDYSIRKYTYK